MGQHICPWWLAYTFDNPLRTRIHKPEKIFSGWVAPEMHVADIGCGMGHFSLGLARMVGDHGKVYAVDVQPPMLDRVAKRADKAGVSHIIETRQCSAFRINLDVQLDGIVAFWMVHETPDAEGFFRQLQRLLKPGGSLLVSEPKFHVRHRLFEEELILAQGAGLTVISRPSIAFSHAAWLRR